MNIFDNPNSETATNSSLIDASDRTLDPYGFVPTLLNKREPGAALNSIELAGKNHVNTDGIDRSDRGLFTSRLYPSQFDVSEADQSAGGDLITGGDTGENQPVEAAIQTAEDLLNKFAVEPDFITKMQTAFGNSFDARKTGFFADSWRNGELGRLPGIEVRSQSDLAGANGAFAAATNTIYLAQEFVEKNSGDVKALASVFLEEYGHYIDSQINTTDAAGDEGEIFAALVQGKDLSASDILVLKGEDDSAIVLLGGELVRIEQKTESDKLNFFGNNLSVWENNNFGFNREIEGLVTPRLNVPLNLGLPPGAPVSTVAIQGSVDASVGIVPYVNLGNLGRATFDYPINIDIERSKETLGLGENFSLQIIPTVEEVSFKGSGFNFANAGVDLKYDIGPISFDKFALGSIAGLGSIYEKNIPPITFDRFNGKANLVSLKIGSAEVEYFGGLFKAKIESPDITEFEKKLVNSGSLLPSLEGKGTGNFFTLTGDVDLAAAKLFPAYNRLAEGLKKFSDPDSNPVVGAQLTGLGFSLQVPNQKGAREFASISADMLDVTANLALGIEQIFRLKDPKVDVTLSVDNGAIDGVKTITKTLGEPFSLTTPSSGSGVMRVDAKYSLSGLVENQIDIINQGFMQTDVLKGEVGWKFGKIGNDIANASANALPRSFGPVYTKKWFENQSKLKTLVGSEETNPIWKIPSFGIDKIGGTEDQDKNLIVEKTYYIPYNMPVTISDVTIKEGDNPPPGAGQAYFKFGGKYYEWETYTVQPGDTLSQIALSRLGSASPDAYNFIAFENNISNPDLIFANTQVIQVPKQVQEPDKNGYAVFDITQSGTPNAPAKIKFNTADGTATAGSDYISTSGNLSVPAGGSAVILVPIVGDTQKEEEETEDFTVVLTKQDGTPFADGVNEIDATGTIIDNDEKPDRPDDGGSTYNDPRIVTIDKQYHDFQAVGEFTLVESTSGDLKIQVRQEPLGSDRLGSVTENTAVSTVLGGKRIGIYRDRGLLIDGIPTNIANNDSLIIGDGRIYREGSTYTVVYRTGDQLVASVGSRVNINVFLTKERQGQIKGLFGNFNGDPKDDLAKRDGTVLSTPIPFRQLYGEYADSWRISQGESLFDYKSGEDTNTFTNKNFPRQKVTLKDLSAADIQKAEELIGNSITNPAIREAAIIDLVLTNFDPSIVEAAIASQTPDSILAIAIPPRAFEDFSSTFVNTPIKINVVENDEGTLGVALAIANFDATTTKGGNIKLDDNATPDNKSDDQLIYTPPANFTGIDTFNYTLTDGKETSTSKVTISVPAFNLSTLNGSNGFVLNGSNAGNFTGVSTSSIGDFNSDGFDDLIIGAFGADPNGNNAAGESYVLFGSKAGFPVNFNPANLNGSNGFIINGVDTNGFSGGAVSSAGDVNGDGIDDLAIGVFGATANGKNNAGKTYIVFGSKNPFPVRFNLSELNGNNGFVFNGNNEFDYVGLSISKLGDLNGDSLDDLLVNAPGPLNSSAGKSYIIYGRKGSFSPSLNTTDINGTNGFVINDTDGNSGSSVKGVGDINGDGMADLIIGTDAANPDNNTPGKIQVLFGSRTGFPAVVNRSELNGKNGFIIEGVEINTSTFVSGAGDINGDGINDLIIGVADATANNNSAAGKTYIVFGKKAEFAPLVNLNQLNGSNGFVINGTQIEERSGISVDGAGDINGDGFDDIIIGASGASANGNNAAGKSYILFGSNQAFPASFNLAELNGNNGFIFNGATADDLTGTAVSSAGDINGDGLGDIIIGTPGSLFNNAPGKSYVVFGNTAFGGVYKPSSDPADLELVQTISNKTPYIGDEVTLKYTLTNKGKGVARRIKITDLLPPGVSFLSAATDQGIYDSNTGMWEVGNIRENLSRTLDIVVKVEKTGSLVTTGQVTAVRETDPDSIPNNNNPAEDDQDSEEFGVAGGGGLTLVFDERYYLAQHADVKAAVEKRKFKNGFSHFVRHGEKENRDFRVLVFDESYYLAQNPDVKAAVEKRKFRSGLRHFIEWGQFEEQRKPNSFDPTAKRLQFDEDYYLQQNSDVEKAVEKRKFRTGFAHFIEWGQIEGRKPSLTGVNLLPG